MSRILVTGCLGYIGSVLSPSLRDQGHEVLGFDLGLFLNSMTGPSRDKGPLYLGDIRSITSEDLQDVEFVVHLAGLSNDPLGALNPGLTRDINFFGAAHLATEAKKAGVSGFVFFSTQSVYGYSDTQSEVDENSPVNPVTEYASSKFEAEEFLHGVADDTFKVLVFRPSTVCGWSPRFRSDIVLNNFVVTALESGLIEVRSDGSPWRPVVDIEEVTRCVDRGLASFEDLDPFTLLNLGPKGGNYRVSDLASAVSESFGNVPIRFTGEHTDPRSYRVNFSLLERTLGLVLKNDLQSSIEGMRSGIEKIRNRKGLMKLTNRLEALNKLPFEARGFEAGQS